jgi:transcription elongation factor Elf1
LPFEKKKQKGNGWAIKCPFCKEGKSSWKTRCDIVLPTQLHNHITVHCYNCGITTNVRNLIAQVTPSMVNEYDERSRELFIEGLKNGTTTKKMRDVVPVIDVRRREESREDFLKYQFRLNLKYFRPAADYPEAVEFCKKRCIFEHIDRLYYNIHPNRPESGMIIFPFETKSGLAYGWQGRHTSEKRFHTFSKNEGFKVFGLFQCDITKPVIVCESIIDSLNINNAIACVGAELSKYVIENFLIKENLIFSLDRDSRGMATAEKYCAEGYRVFVWPPGINIKDFNDLAREGWSADRLTEFIKTNSYKGLELKTKLTFQKMRKNPG